MLNSDQGSVRLDYACDDIGNKYLNCRLQVDTPYAQNLSRRHKNNLGGMDSEIRLQTYWSCSLLTFVFRPTNGLMSQLKTILSRYCTSHDATKKTL